MYQIIPQQTRFHNKRINSNSLIVISENYRVLFFSPSKIGNNLDCSKLEILHPPLKALKINNFQTFKKHEKYNLVSNYFDALQNVKKYLLNYKQWFNFYKICKIVNRNKWNIALIYNFNTKKKKKKYTPKIWKKKNHNHNKSKKLQTFIYNLLALKTDDVFYLNFSFFFLVFDSLLSIFLLVCSNIFVSFFYIKNLCCL